MSFSHLCARVFWCWSLKWARSCRWVHRWIAWELSFCLRYPILWDLWARKLCEMRERNSVKLQWAYSKSIRISFSFCRIFFKTVRKPIVNVLLTCKITVNSWKQIRCDWEWWIIAKQQQTAIKIVRRIIRIPDKKIWKIYSIEVLRPQDRPTEENIEKSQWHQ